MVAGAFAALFQRAIPNVFDNCIQDKNVDAYQHVVLPLLHTFLMCREPHGCKHCDAAYEAPAYIVCEIAQA